LTIDFVRTHVRRVSQRGALIIMVIIIIITTTIIIIIILITITINK